METRASRQQPVALQRVEARALLRLLGYDPARDAARPGAAQLCVGRGVYLEMGERVAAEDEPALAIELAQVRRWRHEQFVLLGFSEAQAQQLADSEADLGQARYLVDRGCSFTLAVQILS
jgi:hypothetical protein